MELDRLLYSRSRRIFAFFKHRYCRLVARNLHSSSDDAEPEQNLDQAAEFSDTGRIDILSPRASLLLHNDVPNEG
jgi:hypothetical protein